MPNKVKMPEKYDIIHGSFFDRTQLSIINSTPPLYKAKYHYMLVIAVLPNYNLIEVILGTSTKYNLYDYKFVDNDLIVQSDESQNGLKKETLFSINCFTIGVIESTDEFLITPEGYSTAIVGRLSDDDIKEYERIKNKYPQILNISKKILGSGYPMLSLKLFEDPLYYLPYTDVKDKE